MSKLNFAGHRIDDAKVVGPLYNRVAAELSAIDPGNHAALYRRMLMLADWIQRSAEVSFNSDPFREGCEIADDFFARRQAGERAEGE